MTSPWRRISCPHLLDSIRFTMWRFLKKLDWSMSRWLSKLSRAWELYHLVTLIYFLFQILTAAVCLVVELREGVDVYIFTTRNNIVFDIGNAYNDFFFTRNSIMRLYPISWDIVLSAFFSNFGFICFVSVNVFWLAYWSD